jgi:hypothetical protein
VNQDHADAVLALLRAAAGSPPLQVLPLEDGTVPAGLAPPYARAYVTVERTGGTDLSGDSDLAICRTILHQIGADDIAARAVADRCAGALLDVTPTVPGRVCWPIRHEAQRPPTRDESTGPMVIDQVDVYVFASVPA